MFRVIVGLLGAVAKICVEEELVASVAETRLARSWLEAEEEELLVAEAARFFRPKEEEES